VIGIDGVVVGEEAVDGEIAVLGAHVGHQRRVGDGGMRAEAARPTEEAHLVSRRPDRNLDAERPQEPVGPEASAVDDHRCVDVAALRPHPDHP